MDATTRSSLVIALTIHAIAFLVFFVWAAKTGKFDPLLRAINVVQVKEKKPEPRKPEPKTEDLAKPAVKIPEAVLTPPTATAPPATGNTPPPAVAPAVAPPPVEMPAMDFSDGAKEVISTTDAPIYNYKNLVEYSLRSNWSKPEDVPDNQFVAEVQIAIDERGKLTRYDWIKGSGDNRWDESVRQALKATKSIGSSPPPGFPDKFIVRFDVLSAPESAIQ